ncbi:MAG TPA: DUF1993 domain-containing protein [Kofleriaceae bacterium]
MHIYDLTVPQLIKTLRNLDRWLTLANTHAQTANIPVESLITARLAPDQYSLVRQVQVATDNAKFIPGRLAGKEWPSHPDTETTFDQLHARIASVQSYIESFSREDFDDIDKRKIRLPWMKPDQWLDPHDYVVQFALPNFYFHVVTAYAILRHKGVQLGKNDYIGGLPMQP